jgi:hypothetical protein
VAALVLAVVPAAGAQSTPPVQNVEVDPIRCFWRTSTDAVRVGEPLTLTLTCSVLDTAATTVVPDQSRLDPGVLQLPPFEVRSGTQAPDLHTASRRYFQYAYELRYVGEEAGRDLQLPALTLSYHVQSRVQQDAAAVEGRDRQYILPAHTVRILSIVPAATRDIRDVAPVTLADIDGRRFRASVLRVTAIALYAIAAVVAAWALLAATRRRRAATGRAPAQLSDSAVLAEVVRELAAVRQDRAANAWTSELAARGLSALRIAAAYAAGTPVVQTPLRGGTQPLPGQLRIASGLVRRTTRLVSASATAVTFTGSLRRSDDAVFNPHADDLTRALHTLSAGVYGREGVQRDDDLDDALATAERTAAAVRRAHRWPATWLRALRTWLADSRKAQGWARS